MPPFQECPHSIRLVADRVSVKIQRASCRVGNGEDIWEINRRGDGLYRAATCVFCRDGPLRQGGLENISPKGLQSFAVLDRHRVACVDLTGSGIETVALLRENGWIVLMLWAFEGAPKILRLHGSGTVVEPQDIGFQELTAHCPSQVGVRAIIRI